MRSNYDELLGVGPGELGELFNGDPAAMVVVLEAALVYHIGGLLAALGDDVVGTEVVGGGLQVGQRKLRESQHAPGPRGDCCGGFGAVRHGCSGGDVVVIVVMTVVPVLVVFWMPSFQ